MQNPEKEFARKRGMKRDKSKLASAGIKEDLGFAPGKLMSVKGGMCSIQEFLMPVHNKCNHQLNHGKKPKGKIVLWCPHCWRIVKENKMHYR